MVQHIALMMTYNEADCIEEVMNEHTKYFDKILVLDGSNDGTEEILRSYPQVKYLIKDKDIIDKLPNHKIEDGARQFLLEKAQEMYGYEGWITLLHGDEVFYDNPVQVAEAAEREKADKVNWYVMNFFLHTSDMGKDLESNKSLQERVTWYCPGFLEIRQYRNKKGIYYNPVRGGKTLAEGVSWRIYSKFPVYKHYPFRSVAQMLRKKKQHDQTGFACTYRYLTDERSCFRDILPGFKVARKYDGSFHEFEMKRQGSLLWRWLRSGRYLPIRIGKIFD